MMRQEEIKDKDLDGCTFKPQLVSHHKSSTGAEGGSHRNFDKFVEDQQKYLELKKERAEQRKNEASIQETSLEAPMVCEGTLHIIEGKEDRKSKPTYERLYELNKSKQQTAEEAEESKMRASKVNPSDPNRLYEYANEHRGKMQEK